MSPSAILTHWAIAKMNAADHSMSDERLAELILRKLENYKGVSYSELVDAALKAERRKLANLVMISLKTFLLTFSVFSSWIKNHVSMSKFHC